MIVSFRLNDGGWIVHWWQSIGRTIHKGTNLGTWGIRRGSFVSQNRGRKMGSQSAFCHHKLVCIDLGKVCKLYPFCKFYLSPAVFTAEKCWNIFKMLDIKYFSVRGKFIWFLERPPAEMIEKDGNRFCWLWTNCNCIWL